MDKTEEKGSDVHLASHLLRDAHLRRIPDPQGHVWNVASRESSS
jgi:hypothetical protein